MNQAPPIKPPKALLRFFRWFCDPDLREDLEGDLIELYKKRAVKSSAKAKTLFFRDVLLMFRPGIIKNFEGHNNSNNYGMLKNYLKTALRNLKKHKGFSAINILSLSIGMAACIAIFLFVKDERSFDQFHSKKETIYRLIETQSFSGTNIQNVPLSMPGMGPTLTEEFPEIQSFVRFWNWGELLVEKGDKRFIVDQVGGVDSTFFQVFDFELVSGDRASAFNNPNNAVISEDIAMRLFGNLDVLDETLVVDGNTCIIKGVMKNAPENSHIQYDIYLSIKMSTQNRPDFDAEFSYNFLNTYLVLSPSADLNSMEERFPEYLVRMTGNEDIADSYALFLQPLSDVHLASVDILHDYSNYRKFNGSYINIFILVGIFIIIIASLNFMNLTTARASNRAKEVGVRKTIGAFKSQLFSQFIVESLLLSFLALLMAIGIVFIGLPFLNSLIDRQLTLISFLTGETLLTTLITTLILGVLAGLYPSLHLSAFKPIVVLKGFRAYEKKSVFRSSLIVVQFSLALGMIISTLIVLQQLNFMKNKDVGFIKDQMVLIKMSEQSNEKYDEMKQVLLSKSSILGVTASNQRLGNNYHQWGFKLKNDSSIVSITPSNTYVDYDFLDVYDIDLASGRNFSKEYASDDGLSFIVNEAFVKEFNIDNPVGKKLGHGWYPDDSLGTIVGVVKDFNFNSLHFAVNTLVMEVHEDWNYTEMSIKVKGENIDQALNDIEDVYGEFVTSYPLNVEFLDDQLGKLYKTDEQMSSVVTIIAFLSVLIGCMGLYGLASISIQRRIKEVGIRKVMGASIMELMAILSKNFARIILIAFVLATPLTYIFLSGWLENFAYRIEINPLIFILGGFLALIIALATISFHVLKAANANPVKALKCE